MNPLETLKHYWGYTSFRNPQQQQVINAVLEGQDVLALLPTGGGKSLCFQVPTMMKEGLCIVISPLVALIEDQVSNLKKKNIRAIGLMGSYGIQELDVLLTNCIHGGYKFLYLSPERLQQDLVRNRIEQMNVNLIAVDEAHCISQWGRDFRPSYYDIGLLRDLHPKVPIIALTATSTPKVIEDISDSLNLHNLKVVIASFERPNIAYHIVRHQHKLKVLDRVLSKLSGTAIVYVNSRNASVEYAKSLQGLGYAAAYFHGGLSSEEKKQTLQGWMRDKLRIIVATSAFGMGIDKPDVRIVVHLHIPSCIEDYYQETGRAGRDGMPSKAIAIVTQQDASQAESQYLNHLPDVAFVKSVYRKLCSHFQLPYGEHTDEVFYFDVLEFCNQYKLHSNKTYSTFEILNKYKVIRLSQFSRQTCYLEFLVRGHTLQDYLSRVPSAEPVAQSILRAYVGRYQQTIAIDVDRLARKINMKANDFRNCLKRLNDEQIIKWKEINQDTQIEFLLTREDDYNINPFSKYIRSHAKIKQHQISHMINYVNDDRTCKAKLLLHYFGEDKTEPCGQCSVCIAKNTNAPSKGAIQKEIRRLLHETPRNSQYILKTLTFGDCFIMEALTDMLREELLILNQKQEYQLR